LIVGGTLRAIEKGETRTFPRLVEKNKGKIPRLNKQDSSRDSTGKSTVVERKRVAVAVKRRRRAAHLRKNCLAGKGVRDGGTRRDRHLQEDGRLRLSGSKIWGGQPKSVFGKGGRAFGSSALLKVSSQRLRRSSEGGNLKSIRWAYEDVFPRLKGVGTQKASRPSPDHLKKGGEKRRHYKEPHGKSLSKPFKGDHQRKARFPPKRNLTVTSSGRRERLTSEEGSYGGRRKALPLIGRKSALSPRNKITKSPLRGNKRS